MFWNKKQLKTFPIKISNFFLFHWFLLMSTFFSRKRLRMTLENGKKSHIYGLNTIKYFENDNSTFTNLKQSQSKILIILFTWIEKNFNT